MDNQSPNKYPGVLYVAVSFVMSWVLIFLTTYSGVSSNTLHSSAQSWAFVVVLATLAGYGLTAVTSLVKPPGGEKEK